MSGATGETSSGTTAAADNNENRSGGDTGAGRRGEGSSRSTRRPSASTTRTLGDVMREPSTTVPGVVVLDALPEAPAGRDTLDPKEDLWLSTVDGRYSSPIIPLQVGVSPRHETFYVHKKVLLKSEYFERALCGEFRESGMQSIDLPEEDPAIFHFLVAYLYEGKYEPIKPAASVLIPDEDKGKAITATDETSDSDLDSISSSDSDVSARSRRQRERRRRREERHWEHMRRKHPGMHRPNCNCPTCTAVPPGPPCWSCRATRNPPPGHPATYSYDPWGRPDRPPPPPAHRPQRRRHGPFPRAPILPPPQNDPPSPQPPGSAAWLAATTATDPNGGRITDAEDLRTWLLAYELHIDVYILANKFLLDGFKHEIARAAVDMLESAGSDAAVVEVLYLCRKLYDGLPESDPLLKMIFARVGFLQPWKRAPQETNEFLVANPEIASLLLREMAARREEDVGGKGLPSMIRPWSTFGRAPVPWVDPGPGAGAMGYRGPPPPYNGLPPGAGYPVRVPGRGYAVL
ncbi:hypothetical protein VTI74DRAFT_5771 [Chaetomium olivicolor]